MKNFLKGILTIITIIILVFIFNVILEMYRVNYFNEFSRAELNTRISQFSRDGSVKYGDSYSYKIKSDTMNDAVFYKPVNVEKNTAYKVTCKVKTEDVVPEKSPSESGAHISIIDTTEKSESISGTGDWQEITMYFNSYDREQVNIGFRLGGFQENCTGTAWFSDFKLEKGQKPTTTDWDVACFIIKNIDINIDQNSNNVKVSMNENDIYNTKLNMQRFKTSCEQLSERQMTVDYDIFEIDEPLTSISRDDENGYYVAGINVASLIDKYLKDKEYDHIFVTVKLGDLDKNVEIPVNDWIGLGSMVYKGTGFSNIRIPSDTNSRIYFYNSVTNTFPEEVMVHEFLHDLERITNDLGYNIPELHDAEKYGYTHEAAIGLKRWYGAYMTKKVFDKANNTYIGLEPAVYSTTPLGESNFKYTVEIDFISEPKNIIEEIFQMFNKTTKLITENYLLKNVEVSAYKNGN